MCLSKKSNKDEALKLCKKSPSKQFIGYKVVQHPDDGTLRSLVCRYPIKVGKNIDTVGPGRSGPIPSYTANGQGTMIVNFYYPKGFHLYALKKDAKLILKEIKKKIKANYTLSILNINCCILPVYFYKKDVLCEGFEYYESEEKDRKPVLVVKEYTVKKNDIPVQTT